MTKDEVLAALPKLDRAGLEAVAAVTASLLAAHTAAPNGPAAPLAAMCFNALGAALNVTLSLQNAPATTQAAFNKRLPDTIEFFNNHFKGWDANKVGQTAFLMMMFEALRDYLIRIGIKPNFGTMINNMPHLARAFDDMFPSYIENGMGDLIIKRIMRKSK